MAKPKPMENITAARRNQPSWGSWQMIGEWGLSLVNEKKVYLFAKIW
jgi:hypothetical protein